jgi:Plavaka transposase
MDIEHPHPNASRISPIPTWYPPTPPPPHNGSDVDPDIDMDIEHPRPNASRVTRVFHPKLNGMLILKKKRTHSLTLTFLFVGEICDEIGNGLPPDNPPAPRDSDTKGPNDWTPYSNRLQFEVADFLFRRNQMSAGDINFLLNLWAASLAIHNDEPPFSKATHLYSTIDSTPLGDVAWDSFSLQYNGTKPESNVPSWMLAEYDVWFRDPRTLVRNLLSNPDFKDDFDYAPFQERTSDGIHRFQDFMSANWAWNQAVSFHYIFFDLELMLFMLGCYCRRS